LNGKAPAAAFCEGTATGVEGKANG
jgi:hypothetical protein